MTSALEVAGVSVSYGKFIAVETATMRMAPGECVALVGPNGHGKSSLVNAIAGIIKRGGQVSAFGKQLPARSTKAAVAAGVVLVPERRHLYPKLSVRDNILLGGFSRTRRLRASKAWDEAADVVDMFPELKKLLRQDAGTLSGGQQQMVALARGLAARPRLLILDEPCLGLAEAVTERLYGWMEEITRTDLAILLVEENPVRALDVCDRMVRIYNGVIAEGVDEAAFPGHAGVEVTS
ncbi:MAG TPA: ATP-binding cassette domain-containing protein [Trebonia sp.]